MNELFKIDRSLLQITLNVREFYEYMDNLNFNSNINEKDDIL